MPEKEDMMTQIRSFTAPTGETILESGPGEDGLEYAKPFYNPEPASWCEATKIYDQFSCDNTAHRAGAIALIKSLTKRHDLGHMGPNSCSTRAIADTAIGACGCVIVGNGYYIKRSPDNEVPIEWAIEPQLDENLTTV